ncbi:MAG: LarC family nickel insertion protein [Candidatus Hodarchaeota archaeon]
MKTIGKAKILYIDCLAGLSGDMFLSALQELCETSGLNAGEIKGVIQLVSDILENVHQVQVEFVKVEKNGFESNFMRLDIDETINDHGSSGEVVFSNLRECLQQVNFSSRSKAEEFALAVFNILLTAEKRVHGIDGGGSREHHVHLHELSSADTIIDIIGVTKALDMLGFFDEREQHHVKSGPVSVGTGTIKISHGTVSVPAPATLEILKTHGIPFIVGPVEGFELATPTGCAILAALKPEFEPIQAPSTLIACGRGAGKKDFSGVSNILKVLLLEESREELDSMGLVKMVQAEVPDNVLNFDKIVQLTITIDDQAPEDVGYLIEKTYDLGAREVYMVPAHMKKSRTGVEVRILSRFDEYIEICLTWLKESTTLGCRVQVLDRVKLEREIKTIDVSLQSGSKEYVGKVRVKYIPKEFITTPTGSLSRPEYKIEHDDLKLVAESLDISLHDARQLVKSKLDALKEA